MIKPRHPGRLKKQIGWKKLAVGALHGHMRKNAYFRNSKWTFEDLLPYYCYAIKTHRRTIRSLVLQPSSAVKGADKSELQSYHCMFEQIKLVNHIRTAVRDHPNCLWNVDCQIVSVLTFLIGVFAKLKRGYVKRHSVALSV